MLSLNAQRLLTLQEVGDENAYLAWQDAEDRRWLPVGRLSFDGHVYRFVYTKGAEQSPALYLLE